MNAHANTTRRVWSDRTTTLALGLWGAVHVIGGASLLAASTTDGLDALAPDAATVAPTVPGEGTEALLRFHALNIVLGGLAVFVLIVWWARSQVQLATRSPSVPQRRSTSGSSSSS